MGSGTDESYLFDLKWVEDDRAKVEKERTQSK